jgi:hypothetical protein
VDSYLAAIGGTTVKKLYESHVGTRSVEGEEGEDSEPEAEVVPNFAEA